MVWYKTVRVEKCVRAQVRQPPTLNSQSTCTPMPSSIHSRLKLYMHIRMFWLYYLCVNDCTSSHIPFSHCNQTYTRFSIMEKICAFNFSTVSWNMKSNVLRHIELVITCFSIGCYCKKKWFDDIQHLKHLAFKEEILTFIININIKSRCTQPFENMPVAHLYFTCQ